VKSTVPRVNQRFLPSNFALPIDSLVEEFIVLGESSTPPHRASIPIDLAIGTAPPTAESASYGGAGSAIGLVFAAPMVLLAVLDTIIVLGLDGNRIGWLLLAAIVSLALGALIQDYGTYAISLRHRAIPGGDLATGLGAYGWLFFVAMVWCFQCSCSLMDGRFRAAGAGSSGSRSASSSSDTWGTRSVLAPARLSDSRTSPAVPSALPSG